jgi:hypothetical protein
MSDIDALGESIAGIASRVLELQLQAAQEYKPLVDAILESRSQDVKHIEHTLDGLLDFCGYAPVLLIFKRLCRYYWHIDPSATASYIDAYRRYWDSETAPEPPAEPEDGLPHSSPLR